MAGTDSPRFDEVLLLSLFSAAGVLLFCLGICFVVPLLSAIIILCSSYILAQNLIGSIIPRNALPLLRYLAGALGHRVAVVRNKTHNVLFGWLGLSHFLFVLPAFVALLFLIQPTTTRLHMQVANLIDTASRAIKWLMRISRTLSSRLMSIFFIQRARHLVFWLASTTSRQIDSGLWVLINSPITDALIMHFRFLEGAVFRFIQVPASIFGVIFLVPLLSLLQDGVISMLRLQVMFLSAPLIMSRTVLTGEKERSHNGQAVRILEQQRSNFRIYESIPLKSKVSTSTEKHNSSVRLFDIAPGLEDSPIRIKLYVADLSELGHEFVALSYVWDSSDLFDTIEVNGRSFAVSKTLRQALGRLRCAGKPRTIWVDAICINQGDLHERSEQVQLMDQIYSQAQCVVVWLGEHTPLGLREMLQKRKHLIREGRGAQRPLAGAVNIHYGAVRMVSKLLRSPWWTRMWVVQEAVLARSIELYCGPNVIEWDLFCQLVTTCFSMPYASTAGLYYDEFCSIKNTRAQRESLRLAYSQTPNGEGYSVYRSNALYPRQFSMNCAISPGPSMQTGDIASLIYEFRGRHSTEPRDRVFALQGLIDQPSSRLVVPDYARHISSLSIDIARAHIQSSRSLCIVALTECARQTTPARPDNANENKKAYIPSWCPAFMDQQVVSTGLNWRHIWTGFPPGHGGDDIFAAAGRIEIPLDKIESGTNCSGEDDDATIRRSHRLRVYSVRHLQLVITHVGSEVKASYGDLTDTISKIIDGKSSSFLPSMYRYLSWETVLPSWRAMVEKYGDNHPRQRFLEDGTSSTTAATAATDTTATTAELAVHGRNPEPARGLSAADSLEQSWHRTLTAGRYSGSLSPSSQPTTASPEKRRPEQKENEQREEAEGKDGEEEYLRVRKSVCAGRRMFVTSAGDFGLGPAGLKVGDELHVLLGSQVPMILRQAKKEWKADVLLEEVLDNEWLYIGQAYVDGLMFYQGDLGRDIDSGVVELEERLLV